MLGISSSLTVLRLFSVLVSGALCVACAQVEQRDAAYRVVTEQHISDSMRSMSRELSALVQLSMDETRSETEKNTSVMNRLTRIEDIASQLGGPEVVTNYSVLNWYMGAFLYDVSLAQEFAQRSPPNHFPSYTLVKSCLSCHGSID